jgi:hypothetical protein
MDSAGGKGKRPISYGERICFLEHGDLPFENWLLSGLVFQG